MPIKHVDAEVVLTQRMYNYRLRTWIRCLRHILPTYLYDTAFQEFALMKVIVVHGFIIPY